MPRGVFPRPPLSKTFWEKVDENGSIHPRLGTRCWLWTGGRSGDGYGAVRAFGSMQGAHRVAWVLANDEEIPAGMWVLHHCDNPICCNPEHLYLGTVVENSEDCNERKRRNPARGERHGTYTQPSARTRGTKNGMAVLDDEGVRQIRSMRREGATQQRIADHFGVSLSCVNLILTGKNWRHVQ